MPGIGPDREKLEAILARLRPRQAAYVRAYVTPGPARGIQTRAVAEALPHLKKTKPNLRIAAARIMRQPGVADAIAEAVATYGTDDAWAMERLAAVARGDYVTEETVTRHTPDGDVRTTTVQRRPRASDVIRAVDTVLRMRGVYARQEQAAVLSQRFATLAARHATKLGLFEHGRFADDTHVPSTGGETLAEPPRRHRGRPKRESYIIGICPVDTVEAPLAHPGGRVA